MFDIIETLIMPILAYGSDYGVLEKTDYGLLIKYFYVLYGVPWASKLQQVMS